MKRRISFPRGLTGAPIRPRARLVVEGDALSRDAALSPPWELFRLDALGVDEAGPVLDLADQLGVHRRAGNDVRRNVELSEALGDLRVSHDFCDRLGEL